MWEQTNAGLGRFTIPLARILSRYEHSQFKWRFVFYLYLVVEEPLGKEKGVYSILSVSEKTNSNLLTAVLFEIKQLEFQSYIISSEVEHLMTD